MEQRIAARWLGRLATQEGMPIEYHPRAGYVLLRGSGSIREVAQALGRYLARQVPEPVNVSRVRGFPKAFSFHWSNAQRAWDVIPVREFPWALDGAEVIVFVGPDALSPLGKLWTLPEMRYVAKLLPDHPGYARSVESGGR